MWHVGQMDRHEPHQTNVPRAAQKSHANNADGALGQRVGQLRQTIVSGQRPTL